MLVVTLQPVAVGEVVEEAVVHRVDPSVGLLLKLPSAATVTAAYAHVSKAVLWFAEGFA